MLFHDHLTPALVEGAMARGGGGLLGRRRVANRVGVDRAEKNRKEERERGIDEVVRKWEREVPERRRRGRYLKGGGWRTGVAERAMCSAGAGGGRDLLAVSLIRLRAVRAVT